jgi:cell division protein FtsB
VKRRLECYIRKNRIAPCTSNKRLSSRKFKNEKLREEVEFLSTNVSYLKEDTEFQSRSYPTKLKRTNREKEELEETIENINRGAFP